MGSQTHIMRAAIRSTFTGKAKARTWCGIRDDDDRRFPYIGERHALQLAAIQGIRLCDRCLAAREASYE